MTQHFASVQISETCYWPDSDGVAQTWEQFFESQYPYIVPTLRDGQAYFGLSPSGVWVTDDQELKSIASQGVVLLTAEEYRAATQDELP